MRSLFADDRAVWKRGRNINHITGKIQEAIEVVENGHMHGASGFQ